MIKATKLKGFKIGYGDEKLAFHPRMISLAEQEEIEQKLFNISDTDDEKFKKRFDLKLEAIAEWSGESPQKITKVKGENVFEPLVENAESNLDAVKRYFAERTPENERIVASVYGAFVNLLAPEIDFL